MCLVVDTNFASGLYATRRPRHTGDTRSPSSARRHQRTATRSRSHRTRRARPRLRLRVSSSAERVDPPRASSMPHQECTPRCNGIGGFEATRPGGPSASVILARATALGPRPLTGPGRGSRLSVGDAPAPSVGVGDGAGGLLTKLEPPGPRDCRCTSSHGKRPPPPTTPGGRGPAPRGRLAWPARVAVRRPATCRAVAGHQASAHQAPISSPVISSGRGAVAHRRQAVVEEWLAGSGPPAFDGGVGGRLVGRVRHS